MYPVSCNLTPVSCIVQFFPGCLPDIIWINVSAVNWYTSPSLHFKLTPGIYKILEFIEQEDPKLISGNEKLNFRKTSCIFYSSTRNRVFKRACIRNLQFNKKAPCPIYNSTQWEPENSGEGSRILDSQLWLKIAGPIKHDTC